MLELKILFQILFTMFYNAKNEVSKCIEVILEEYKYCKK